jgi:hypothetical protein
MQDTINEQNAEIVKLQEQVQKLRNDMECKLCCERAMNAMFYPCGHIGSCMECAARVYCCPWCRAIPVDVIKIHRQ